MLSRCRGIVPGATPMGAGLVPSTGATGAVMMGGPFPCPERGACLIDKAKVTPFYMHVNGVLCIMHGRQKNIEK